MSTHARMAFVIALAAAAAAGAAPGDLIAADPMVETPPGVQAWRIRYRTTTDRGAAIEATGIVAAPREALPQRTRPVIAWTHGAWGVAERCAPSLSPTFFTSTPGLPESVRAGYVVVAADYPGLGSPGTHPFLVGPSAAHANLDAIRAARSIPGAAAGSRAVAWGESQGGHAALWTGALARRYAPDIELLGVAAAAPPTDIARNLTLAADPSVRAMFVSFTAWSWSRHYGAPMSTFGKRPIQNVMLRLAANNCIQLSGTPKLGTILGVAAVRQALTRSQFAQAQPWSGLLRQNSVPTAGLPGPVMIVQGAADRLVSPEVTRDYARRLCRTPTRVRYVDLPGVGHVEVTRETIAQTLAWIGDRFAGRPAGSDCRRI